MTMDIYTKVLAEFKESEMQKLQNTLDNIETDSDEYEDTKYAKWSSQNQKKVVNLGNWEDDK